MCREQSGIFHQPLVQCVARSGPAVREMTRAQWIAFALAATGVVYLTIMAGSPPWIALTLALSFGTYGSHPQGRESRIAARLATETLVLLLFAVAYLFWCESAGTGALGHAGPAIHALLIGSGPLTAIALFLFAYGARRLPYSTVGVLQYIAPTLQFACGVFAFHEPFARTRAIGFALIWARRASDADDCYISGLNIKLLTPL